MLTGQGGETLQQLLTANGYQVSSLTFIFAGFFGTVASYQIDHDDVTQWHRCAVRRASRVVHLAAADEVRQNFRLTNILSCVRHGTEVFLPGVRYEIGGSYQDSIDASVIAFELPVNSNGPTAQAPMITSGSTTR